MRRHGGGWLPEPGDASPLALGTLEAIPRKLPDISMEDLIPCGFHLLKRIWSIFLLGSKRIDWKHVSQGA